MIFFITIDLLLSIKTMSKIIYGTPLYYENAKYNGVYAEEMKRATCCICYNTDNYYSCTICRVCKDGTICCNCFIEYEKMSARNDEISTCPICRNLFIHTMIKDIISEELLYYSKFPTPVSNNLYRRWIYNYLVSDDYLNMREFNMNTYFIFRKHQIKVNKDIRIFKR